jgi:predicted nucleic acid-binding protein
VSVAVVDASVGLKWFVPEVLAAEARRWRNGPDELHTLAFFFDLEIANILWKKVKRAEITRADADLILAQLPAIPVTRHPEAPLLASAFDLGERTQRTVYDCLYVALAVQLGGRMVTADQRLYNSLAGTPWPPRSAGWRTCRQYPERRTTSTVSARVTEAVYTGKQHPAVQTCEVPCFRGPEGRCPIRSSVQGRESRPPIRWRSHGCGVWRGTLPSPPAEAATGPGREQAQKYAAPIPQGLADHSTAVIEISEHIVMAGGGVVAGNARSNGGVPAMQGMNLRPGPSGWRQCRE